MNLPKHKIPIIEIPIGKKVRLFIKREDLTHPEISGNKYWKMFYNVKKYLEKEVSERKIITFGTYKIRNDFKRCANLIQIEIQKRNIKI